ncbi:hypothetical protein K461DRAFT_289171 [Myriangium duriaei CBS 260.36]|uniref:Uncharacterized protein n=1 Tax=Myriangium duriaei CBS 260.36 TaxID=1168546 RepID=A0A9P4MKZ9_9PEZI|nr:hypothetical protein K461DRAFT_289171 [Myriangium duriaei CBS 260.36]
MKLDLLLLLAAVSAASASTVNGKCSVNGAPGACIDAGACTQKGGKTHTNYCPGTPDNIKCCTKSPCDGSKGVCDWTCTGNSHFITDHCPGPTGFKCCVAPDPPICGGGKRCIPPF